MNRINLAPWWKLTDRGFPTATQAAKALGLSHEGIGKYLKSGQRKVSSDRLPALLDLDQPEGAKEYLEALIRGAPPEELSKIEARAATKKNGPAPTQKTEKEPNPSQVQSSSPASSPPPWPWSKPPETPFLKAQKKMCAALLLAGSVIKDRNFPKKYTIEQCGDILHDELETTRPGSDKATRILNALNALGGFHGAALQSADSAHELGLKLQAEAMARMASA